MAIFLLNLGLNFNKRKQNSVSGVNNHGSAAAGGTVCLPPAPGPLVYLMLHWGIDFRYGNSMCMKIFMCFI